MNTLIVQQNAGKTYVDIKDQFEQYNKNMFKPQTKKPESESGFGGEKSLSLSSNHPKDEIHNRGVNKKQTERADPDPNRQVTEPAKAKKPVDLFPKNPP